MFVKVTGHVQFVEIESNFQSWRTQRSRTNKETQLYSHMRGKKTEENPFCGKRTGITKQSNGDPQRGMKFKNYEMPLETLTGVPRGHLGFKQFFQNQFGLFQPYIKLRKTNSALWYSKVCKVTRWHNVVNFNFPWSDLSLCIVEFRLNKVFWF